MTIEVTEDFDLSAHSDGVPLLLKFSASWCGPCQRLAPVLDAVAAERGFGLAEVDVDRFPGLSDRFAVRGVPTVLLVSKGEILGRMVGAGTTSSVRDFIERHLPGA